MNVCSRIAISAALLLLPGSLFGQKFYTYIGELGHDHVTIAWGTTEDDNTIGRSSPSHGPAKVRVGDCEVAVSNQNWVRVEGLAPDTEYPYEVTVRGNRIAASKFRTWAEKSEKLRFFVIGDFGSGDSVQQEVARAMVKEFNRLQGENPVRFVLTTGDNLYGKFGFGFRFKNTGAEDDEWEDKFFQPYQQVLAHIPFYPTLGNHDGNETEEREDLEQYLDNFFFPNSPPARYYRFSYGGLADFFALDSTTNSEKGPTRPIFLPDSDQHKWLQRNLADSRVKWKIPYFHHPPFNAGPRHPGASADLAHFLKDFNRNGVKVVFSGHEHNFQFSSANGPANGVRYVVTGAGGELRTGSVISNMQSANIEGWAPVAHFLSVEIEGDEMRITPITANGPAQVVGRNRQPIQMPLRIRTKSGLLP